MTDTRDKRYYLLHLFHHLKGIERWDDVHKLLGDKKWMMKKYQFGDLSYHAYLDDVHIGKEGAFRENRLDLLLRYALMESSIASISNQYSPEIAVALIETGERTATSLLPYLEQIRDEKARLFFASAIFPYLNDLQQEDTFCKYIKSYIDDLKLEEKIVVATRLQNTEFSVFFNDLQLTYILDDECEQMQRKIGELTPGDEQALYEYISSGINIRYPEARRQFLEKVAPLVDYENLYWVLEMAIPNNFIYETQNEERAHFLMDILDVKPISSAIELDEFLKSARRIVFPALRSATLAKIALDVHKTSLLSSNGVRELLIEASQLAEGINDKNILMQVKALFRGNKPLFYFLNWVNSARREATPLAYDTMGEPVNDN